MTQPRIPDYIVADPVAARPPLPAADAPDVQVWRARDGSVAVLAHEVESVCWLHFPREASVAFTSEDGPVTITPHVPMTSAELDDLHARRALPFILQARGWEVLHGSAVRVPAGVLAVIGPSGAGKSTLARALQLAGCPMWADDAVLMDPRAEPVTTWRLPYSLRLLPDAAGHFGRQEAAGGTIPVMAHEPVLPMAAIMALDADRPAGGQAAEIVPLTGSEAFETLLADAFAFSLHNPRRTARMMADYLAIAQRVPVYRLRLPAGLAHLEETVAAVLTAAADPRG